MSRRRAAHVHGRPRWAAVPAAALLPLGVLYAAALSAAPLVAVVTVMGVPAAAAAQPACPTTAPTASPGYSVTRLVSGLTVPTTDDGESFGVAGGMCVASYGAAFDDGDMYVSDADVTDGGIFRFPLSGGAAGQSDRVDSTPFVYQLEDGPDGTLYTTVATPGGTWSGFRVVEVDPVTGKVVRTVVSGLSCANYLAVDPRSADLFTEDSCTGSPYDPSIFRISSPSSAHPSVSTYGGRFPDFVNGMAFAPDGTLFAVVATGAIDTVSGTAGPTPPVVHTVATIPDATDVAVTSSGAAGQARTLLVSTFLGDVDLVDLTTSPPRVLRVLTGKGTIMAVSKGPGDCPYIALEGEIYRFGKTGTACAAAGSTLSSIASSIPTPGQAFANPGVVLASVAVAAGGTLFVTFPSQLFNLTLDENYAEIAAWMRRRRRRLEAVLRGVPVLGPALGRNAAAADLAVAPGPAPVPAPATATATAPATAPSPASSAGSPGQARRHGAGAFALVVVVGSVLDALLDPAFGANLRTLESIVTILLSILAGAAVAALATDRYHRRTGARPKRSLHALPLGIAVAAVCVAVSRIAGFEPGYLYGVVCGVAFERKLTARQEGHVAVVSMTAVLLFATIAFFVRGAVEPVASRPGASFAWVMLDDLVSAVVAGGFVGTVIALLPFRFLPGAKIFRWSKRAWAILFVVAGFGLVDFVVRSPASSTSHSGLIATVVFFVIFAGASVVFREVFAARWRRQHGVQLHGPLAYLRDLVSPHAGETTEGMEQIGAVAIVEGEDTEPAAATVDTPAEPAAATAATATAAPPAATAATATAAPPAAPTGRGEPATGSVV